MAYTDKEIYEESLRIINENHNVCFLSDLFTLSSFDKGTFYNHIKKDFNEFDNIRRLLANNKKNRDTTAIERIKINRKKALGIGYIYIVKCGNFDYYKIGISKKDYKTRLSVIQSGCPFELYLIYAHHTVNYSLIEYNIHELYKDKKIRGEWFKLDSSDIKTIKKIIDSESIVQLNIFDN